MVFKVELYRTRTISYSISLRVTQNIPFDLLRVQPLRVPCSHTRSWKSEKINLNFMFWFEVDEHFKNDHFFIFLLHNWNLKESVHEKLIFTPIGIRITVGVSTLVVGTGCTHFNYKIYIRIGWDFFSPHRTLSLIEYLDHIVQNSRIKISVDTISDFRSDSWEKWSTSYQYRVDFVDAMTFKIHERSKKYSKYCTPNESIVTLAWQ